MQAFSDHSHIAVTDNNGRSITTNESFRCLCAYHMFAFEGTVAGELYWSGYPLATVGKRLDLDPSTVRLHYTGWVLKCGYQGDGTGRYSHDFTRAFVRAPIARSVKSESVVTKDCPAIDSIQLTHLVRSLRQLTFHRCLRANCSCRTKRSRHSHRRARRPMRVHAPRSTLNALGNEGHFQVSRSYVFPLFLYRYS